MGPVPTSAESIAEIHYPEYPAFRDRSGAGELVGRASVYTPPLRGAA